MVEIINLECLAVEDDVPILETRESHTDATAWDELDRTNFAKIQHAMPTMPRAWMTTVLGCSTGIFEKKANDKNAEKKPKNKQSEPDG